MAVLSNRRQRHEKNGMKRVGLALNVLAAFAATLTIFAPAASKADRLPELNNDSFTFSTKDIPLVDVYFTNGHPYPENNITKLGVWNEERKAYDPATSTFMLSIPPVYLDTCINLSAWNELKEIPQKAYCRNVFEASFFYPTGVPFSRGRKFEDDLQENNPPTTPFFGKGYDQLKRIRDKTKFLNTHAIIALSKRDLSHWDLMQEHGGENAKNVTYRGRYEGFTEIRRYKYTYFYDNGSDGIRAVQCFDLTERSEPSQTCSTQFRVNDKLVATVSFIDFRLHGGREFLRERVRNFKKIMCPFLKCDENALSAAEVTGGIQ
jgi:hypothetical protein